jgi:hypothetical protein
MTITRADFLRSLLPLERHYRIEIDEAGGQAELSNRTLRAVLRLHQEGSLKLGSLNLSSLRVDFAFAEGGVEEIAKFWSRFDLCYRRGGG